LDDPKKFVDCTGMDCPMPVVMTKRALKSLEIGDVIEMVATDPGAVPDMIAWEKQTKHDLLLNEEIEDGSKFRFLVRKTH